MSDHRVIERQIAAMHAEIAARIRAGDARPMQVARENLARWRVQFGGDLPAAYAQWLDLLVQGEEAVIAVLVASDEDAIRRRSSSPFAGVLTPAERWRILARAA